MTKSQTDVAMKTETTSELKTELKNEIESDLEVLEQLSTKKNLVKLEAKSEFWGRKRINRRHKTSLRRWSKKKSKKLFSKA